MRYHDEIVTRVAQGMLLEIEPVDEDSAEGLISALNRVTVMGEKTDTLFSDAGARSGYIQKALRAAALPLPRSCSTKVCCGIQVIIRRRRCLRMLRGGAGASCCQTTRSACSHALQSSI